MCVCVYWCVRSDCIRVAQREVAWCGEIPAGVAMVWCRLLSRFEDKLMQDRWGALFSIDDMVVGVAVRERGWEGE